MGIENPEREMPSSSSGEFQPTVNQDVERSPFMIAKQTGEYLDLFYKGDVGDPKLAINYFRNSTLPYLNKAKEGADILYDKKAAANQNLSLETIEAARHAFLTLAQLPDVMSPDYSPETISGIGLKGAPATKDEFIKKLEEIRIGLWQTMTGQVETPVALEDHPHLLITDRFFKVGSEFCFITHEYDRSKEQVKTEKFNKLTEGIEVSF
jgi:hypothetical protein